MTRLTSYQFTSIQQITKTGCAAGGNADAYQFTSIQQITKTLRSRVSKLDRYQFTSGMSRILCF